MVNFDSFIESGVEYGVLIGDAVECGNHDTVGIVVAILEYDEDGKEVGDEHFCGLCKESVYNGNHERLDVSGVQSTDMDINPNYPFDIVDVVGTPRVYKFEG